MNDGAFIIVHPSHVSLVCMPAVYRHSVGRCAAELSVTPCSLRINHRDDFHYRVTLITQAIKKGVHAGSQTTELLSLTVHEIEIFLQCAIASTHGSLFGNAPAVNNEIAQVISSILQQFQKDVVRNPSLQPPPLPSVSAISQNGTAKALNGFHPTHALHT